MHNANQIFRTPAWRKTDPDGVTELAETPTTRSPGRAARACRRRQTPGRRRCRCGEETREHVIGIAVDRDGTVTFYNDGARQTLGYTPGLILSILVGESLMGEPDIGAAVDRLLGR